MGEPSATWATWTVRARNLPEHADNAIHTDAGARAAGFDGALVAGVTTYAYLTHPVVAAWGLDWVAGGGGEVRFHAPIAAGEEVACEPLTEGDTVVVEARCGATEPRSVRATLRASRHGGAPPVPRPGQPLTVRRIELAGRWGADYGERAGDDLDVYRREGVVHPAVWPALANHLVAAEVVRGSWIHARSAIRHHAVVAAGATVDVSGTVIARTRRRSGEWAVVDVRIETDGRPVATLEHEAIVALP